MKTIIFVKFVLLTAGAIFNAIVEVGKIPASAWFDDPLFSGYDVCQQGPGYPEPCCYPDDGCDS